VCVSRSLYKRRIDNNSFYTRIIWLCSLSLFFFFFCWLFGRPFAYGKVVFRYIFFRIGASVKIYDGSVCCVVNSNNLLANAGGALNFFFFSNRHLIFLGGIRVKGNTSRSPLSRETNNPADYINYAPVFFYFLKLFLILFVTKPRLVIKHLFCFTYAFVFFSIEFWFVDVPRSEFSRRVNLKLKKRTRNLMDYLLIWFLLSCLNQRI
jgi:hypothetical protein